MRRFVAGFLVGFFLLAAFAWLDGRLARVKINGLEASLRSATQRVEILQARVAELSVEAERRDTVWRQAAARVVTLRDSILVTDTAWVLQYIAATDTALQACSELAQTCAAFRLAADSTISAFEQQQRASNFYIDGLQREVARERASAKRGKVFAAGAFVGGALLGAYVRGQR